MRINPVLSQYLVIFSTLVLSGCSIGGLSPSASNQNSNSTTVTVATQDFSTQSDGSFLYSTNNSANLGQTFVRYTLKPVTGAFTYVVAVSKSSGQAGGGFGMIFQRQDDSDFWLVNIDTQGSYVVEKLVGGVQNFVSGSGSSTWQNSSFLKTGYGITNTLTITFDGNNTYTFSANGSLILSFSDTGMGTAYTSGDLGVTAGVLSTENFPTVPVTVSYAITSPVGVSW